MGSEPSTIMPALIGLLGFVILFGTAVAVLRMLQKRGRMPLGWNSVHGDLRVVRRHVIGWQTLLLVVQVGDRQYVVTAARNGAVTLLDKLDSPLPEGAGEAPQAFAAGGTFAALLNRIARRDKGPSV